MTARAAALPMPLRAAALPIPLRGALAANVTVVTPNKRLARRLAALHDQEQRAAGVRTWCAPAVLPWTAWLERLWLDVVASGCRPDPPRLVQPAQSSFVWRRVVAAHADPLIDEAGAAQLAAEAWSLVQAWGTGGPSWRAWTGGGDDCATFARWADAYGRALVRANGLDIAHLPDWLAGAAGAVPGWRNTAVALAGFIEFTPQQERLLAALAVAGMSIARLETVGDAGTGAESGIRRAVGANPQDELAAALVWARERALADPGATIAIAVEDLATRRGEVRALCEEILAPALQWPGHEVADRPYNISLGEPIGGYPIVAAALGLIALNAAPLPMERAAVLLRSPYVGDAREVWLRRASLEAQWLRDCRQEIAFDDAVVALDAVDPALAQRWRAARSGMRAQRSGTPRQWVEFWRAWLAATGWPGERPLVSAEWQAQRAWDELLAQFATLAPVAQRMTRGEAVAALSALASTRLFQPEAAEAPIQILGPLEAAGLPLDALWIAGLAAERWPPAAQPNALLPLAWQRERNVPHSSAARELAYARALTAQWARGAPEVVFSYAQRADDHLRSASALLPDGPPLLDRAPAVPTARRQFASAPALESVVDEMAPPFAAGSIARGGAGLIEAQADCPFRAVAKHRLDADVWPEPVEGLSPMERGSLVHATLAAFWRSVGDQANLLALPQDVLAARIDAAVAAAAGTLSAARWRRLPAIVRAGEVRRLAGTLRTWIETCDRDRPPFAVVETEASRKLVLSGLVMKLRLDRIDALPDGGLAILDYKSGIALAPARWFDPRPRAPQLGLYALAQRAAAPTLPVRAVAYAQLKPGEFRVQGIAADAKAWPALAEPAAVKFAGLPDWPAVLEWWVRALGALADEVREGKASVAPRDGDKTCRLCGLQALCRISGLPAADAGEAADA